MSHLRRGVHIVSKQLAYLLLFLSVIAILLLGSLFWLSNAIEQRQDEIAVWLSEKIDLPVTIGAADLEHLSFMPKLHIERLQVWSKNRDYKVMNLDSLYLGLDVLKSAQQSEAVLNDVTVKGLDTAIIRDLNGKLSIKGFEFNHDNSSGNTDWLALLSLLNNIELYDISFDYADSQKAYLSGQYSLVNATLEHDNTEWTSQANIKLPSTLGKIVNLQAYVSIEDDFQRSIWKAQVDTEKFELTELAQDLISQYINIKQGRADVNFSIEGKGTHIDEVVSSLELAQLRLTPPQQNKLALTSPVTIDQLRATIHWQQSLNGWQLSAQKMVLDMNGELWPETDFKVKKEVGEWLFSSSYIKLSDLSSIALLVDASPEIIRKQQPAGDLDNFELKYSIESGLKSLAFDLKEGAFLAWRDYPGMSGLTVSVNWHDGLANIGMDSHKLHVYADNWLDKAVYFDSVTGNIRVQQDDDSLSVQTQALRIWNDDLTLQLDGHLEHFESGRTATDLQISLEDVKVNSWKKYVPQKILDADFKEWSASAFVDGVITNGQIELLGDLADFPYEPDTDKGHFKMDLTVEDMQLHFAPDWPDIKGVNGSIKGLGNNLVIKSKHGSIAGFQFVDVTTTINRLMITKPVLTVDGALTGTTQQALEFVRNSPLKQRFSAAVEGVVAKGNSDLNLQLLVPLTNVDSTTAHGYVSFKSSELHYQNMPEIAATKVNGQLNFDGNGVDTNEDITASLLGEPVRVTVKPSNDQTNVTMNGRLTTLAINDIWPEIVPSYIQGETNYTARLNVKEKQLGDFYIDGELFADLDGLEVNAPAPFSKARDQQVSFTVTMNVVKDSPHYLLNYSDVLKAAFTETGNKWKAGIVIGTGTPTLPKNGIQIASNLEQLSLDNWLSWVDTQPKTTNSSSDLLSEVEQLNIAMKVNSLTGFDYEFSNLDAMIVKQSQGWQVELQSDQAVGNIYIPDNLKSAKKLDVNLDKLTLNLPESTSQNSQSTSLWPAMKISIASLNLNDSVLGEFKLDADKTINKWLIKSATLNSETYTALVSSAEWTQDQTGESTRIAFQLKSNDLGGVLSQLNYQRAIEAEQVEVFSELNWNASPLDLSRELLNGQLNFSVAKGKLNDVEPGAAGRIFGLMSVAALPRRLSLDFSDLFAKGFNFDSINSSFQISKGIAKTDDFVLVGPSAKVEISGKTDLVEELYDQTVKITPNVSSTLPLAGAVAGGPVGLGVGAAILLVDKISGSLFGKNIVNLISYKYALTGAWNDPEFKVLLSTSQ